MCRLMLETRQNKNVVFPECLVDTVEVDGNIKIKKLSITRRGKVLCIVKSKYWYGGI